MRLRSVCDGYMHPAVLDYALSGTEAEIVLQERVPERDATNARRATAVLRDRGIMRAEVVPTRTVFFLVMRRGAYVVREAMVQRKVAEKLRDRLEADAKRVSGRAGGKSHAIREWIASQEAQQAWESTKG